MSDPIQIHSGTPGFAGAIVDLMRSLQSALAPHALTQRGPYLNQQIEGQVPTAPSSPPLIHNPQPPGGLGNQSPGLGNSF